MLGGWLEDSGWTRALVQANVASPGTADSFVKASHITKTRHAHQVTSASLYVLLQNAYVASTESAEPVPFEEWCVQRASHSAQFDYWLKTLSLEILLLLFVRSIREGYFQLYIESLTKLMPWMFALDHTHYARWLTVHIRDMMALPSKQAAVFKEFCEGKFVVQTTNSKFSAMAIDQCHEQRNADVKGSGGAIGLMDDPAALRRWMVAGPEVSRIVAEYEKCSIQTSTAEIRSKHHEQHHGVQAAFQKDIKSLTSVLEELGNPFLDDSQDLLVLDTKDIMEQSVKETVKKVETIGKEQFSKYVKERLTDCTVPVTETISKNNLPLFSRSSIKLPSRKNLQVQSLKNDCHLFSRLYISCQIRDGDLDQFFAHENQSAPPSLSVGGKLRNGKKADLLSCLQLERLQTTSAPAVDAKFLDGAAVVQMLNPGTAKTFQNYADLIFMPYVKSQLQSTDRVDIVWDVYIPNSLKNATREKRGKGVRRRVLSTTVIPRDWKGFLRVDENKTELFSLLSHEVTRQPTTVGKVIYATDGRDVLSSHAEADGTNMMPCTQEEADTRLLLHVADAVNRGSRKVCVRTVDTDVIVLAIASFEKINPDELWVAFGSGASFKYIPIHQLVNTIQPQMCGTLPFFHALSGCDTVWSFSGRGKKTAWDTWLRFPEVTNAFEAIMMMPSEINDAVLSVLERFVVLLYERTSGLTRVNDARKHLFAQKSRGIENIPPTQAALVEHIKRACYQANIWNQALILTPQLPCPSKWGWKQGSEGWEPLWTTLPEASVSCAELIRCGCTKGCTGRCKCVKAALKCTALCSCSGNC